MNNSGENNSVETYYVDKELLPIKVKKIYSYDYTKYKKPSVLTLKGFLLCFEAGILCLAIAIFLGFILPILLSIIIGFAVATFMVYFAIMYERYDFIASLCSFVVDENNNIYYIENISNQNISENSFNSLCRFMGFDAGQLIGSASAFKNIHNGQELMKHTELYEGILNSKGIYGIVVRKINNAQLIKRKKNSVIINLNNEIHDYITNPSTGQMESSITTENYKLAVSKKYNEIDSLLSILLGNSRL